MLTHQKWSGAALLDRQLQTVTGTPTHHIFQNLSAYSNPSFALPPSRSPFLSPLLPSFSGGLSSTSSMGKGVTEAQFGAGPAPTHPTPLHAAPADKSRL